MATKRKRSRSTPRGGRKNATRSVPRRAGAGAARRRPARAGTRARATARKPQSGRTVSIGYLFGTALLLLVLVVFLINRAAIRDVMDRTELVDVLQRRMDSAVGREQPAPVPTHPTTGAQPTVPTAPERPKPVPPAPDTAEPRTAPAAVTADRPPAEDAARPARQAPPAAEPEPAPPAADRPPPPARRHRVYFAAVDPSGGISVTGVTRVADASGAPLTETLITLLAGPDAAESNRGLITLIPPAVTLNKVYVRERVAYVDVSESFRFNRLGREGLHAQLQQVVYSATEFPNVEQVQILIDGERIDYLASEGTFVGEPIGREAFQ